MHLPHLRGSCHVSLTFAIREILATFLEVMTLCSLEWLLIWVDPVMLFNWPDQQKVFHTKCTWMTSHQSVVPLKFLQAYWYWEPLATISTLEYWIRASKSTHSSSIWGKHCTKVHFFLLGSNFLLLKWPKSKRKNLHPKEKKCAKRKKVRQKKKNAFLD